MALAGPPAEQTIVQKVSYSRKSATSLDMGRAVSVMLDARIRVEQSSLVNENIVVLLKTSLCRVWSRTSIQDQVGVAENCWDHFGVAKRQGLEAAGLV